MADESLTLHGAWLPATTQDEPCFALWAEAGESAPLVRSRGHPRPAAAPRTHPFAASAEALRAVAAQVGEAENRELIARLPSRPAAPLGATEAVDPAALPALAPWRVPALALDATDASALLLGLPPDDGASPEWRVGTDLRFWQAAARFAFALLAGQRFAPDLVEESSGYVAIWRPLLDQAEDAAQLATLARLMPPACRAISRSADAPVLAPHALLADFLDTIVDARASAAITLPALPKTLSAPARAWLAALSGDDPTVALPAEFVQQFRQWRDAARAEAGGGFRLCFRLDPPETQEPAPPRRGRPVATRDWRLRYFLQASDDPSLLVPAEQVWQARGRTLQLFDRVFNQPQERMLAGFGLAARIFPPIEASLAAARPIEAALSVDEAYAFLREASLLLRGAGFGVLLPNLAAGLNARAKLTTKASKQPEGGIAGLTFTSLIRFDWALALGDQEISPDEFLRLAALKQPLVQVRGQWLELRPEQVEQALALLERHDEQAELTLTEAMHLALAPNPVGGLPVAAVEVEGELGALLARLEQPARLAPLPPPAGLHATMRHYQETGVAWLAFLHQLGLGACLADDMGLGKTLQTIAFLLHLRESSEFRIQNSELSITDDQKLEARSQKPGQRGSGAEQNPDPRPLNPEPSAPALVICPTSVVGNWRREIERFAPGLRVMVHHGADRERAEFAAQAQRHDVVVSAYPLLHRDETQFGAVQWGVVVLDEAQNIKNPDTKQAQAARRLHAAQRIALTGTPVENRLAELWSIFQFLNPGYLGTQAAFQRQFARPIEREQDADAAKRLKALTGPLILRRVKTDPAVISDLPMKNEIKSYCTLTREQATLYEAVVSDTLRQLDDDNVAGMKRRSLVLTTMLRLKQVCNHPAQFLADGSALAGRSGKLDRLVEMLEEARAVGERALIFTQFAEMGNMLQAYLQHTFGEEPLFLHGGTPAKQREPMVRRFQDDLRGPLVFILSIKAGGTGLTLTRANNVFHFDRWWNPAVENQATDRAFRIGQTRSVQVYKYICLGTIEERIDEMIMRKQALSDQIVGTSEDWITELSTDQLRELFTLRAEAVE